MPIGSDGPRLVIVGDTCIDLVMGPVAGWPAVGTETIVDHHEMRAGGSAANAALTMRHLGIEAMLVSQVGNDQLGTWLSNQFDGVAGSLGVAMGPTSMSTGIIHRCGERTLFTTRGHLELISWDDCATHVPQAAQGDIALLTGAFLLPKMKADYPRVIESLSRLGYRIALDTGWPTDGWSAEIRREVFGWLRDCDHVLLNEAEVLGLSGEDAIEPALETLKGVTKPDATLVVKIGSKGAIGYELAQTCAVSAPAIDPFDTIGAGDAFNAGYLAARLGGHGLRHSLEAGCRTASYVISQFPRSAIAPGEISRSALLEVAE